MRVINKMEEGGKPAECLCGTELEYLPQDMHAGAYGSMYITCPVCAKEILLDYEDPMPLTVQNVKWPQHFSLPDAEDFNVDDATIQGWVETCLAQISDKIYPNGSSVHIATGNAMVVINKYGDSYDVFVTKSYANTNIPREESAK